MRDLTIIVFMVIVLKIPLVYVGWILWWAVKSENEIGAEGESSGSHWKPWHRPSGSRPSRGGPHGAPARASARAAHRERKAA